ncbi:hypothetical protein [Pseudomonas putida]|uniref:Uncharacterized protein n=1 Tax=Pseudomonas putida TaxID=303 RepID=A0A7V8EFV4_PSEPU|nr:hypothetical protein [Pseudomonas putida]KAF0253994.1 hypothetical protein GN299_15085 [Pseudomonas putida]
MQLKPLQAAFYLKAASSGVIHQELENELKSTISARSLLRLLSPLTKISEAICQRSMLQKEVFAKTVNHFLLSDSTHGSNLWNKLGWSRSSCLACIFNSPKIWATIRKYFPHRLHPIAAYENEFQSTISRQRINVLDLSATAEAFDITDLEALAQADNREYTLPVFTPEGQTWKLPAGAFSKEGCGSV